MSDVDRLAEQVNEAQRWLAEASVEPPAPAPLDRVKAQVRLALAERWLEQRFGGESKEIPERASLGGEEDGFACPTAPQPVAQVLARVKARVHAALTAEQDRVRLPGEPLRRESNRVRRLGGQRSRAETPPGSDIGRVYRFVSTLAAAACLLLAAGLGFRSAGASIGAAQRAQASLRAVDDLAAVMQRDQGDSDTEWAALDAAVTNLENSLAGRSDDSWDDEWMDVFDEEIEDLMDAAGLSPGVS